MFKKITRFLIDNYFLSIFFACISFVALVSIYRLFLVKPTHVYAKVKVGQGLWWASTQKPPIWFMRNFKKGDQELDLTGRQIAQILSVRYYPISVLNQYQYDIYLLMKLKVSKMGSGKYNFKRSAIGVGAPVDFEFPKVQFSGTIIELSEKPIEEKYQEKIIYISKPFAYPWEYEAIKIGDKYFNGQENVVEILDKQIDESNYVSPIFKSQNNYLNLESGQKIFNLQVKLKIKGQIKDSQFVFGEEQIITSGKTIYLTTQNFQFQDFVITKLE